MVTFGPFGLFPGGSSLPLFLCVGFFAAEEKLFARRVGEGGCVAKKRGAPRFFDTSHDVTWPVRRQLRSNKPLPLPTGLPAPAMGRRSCIFNVTEMATSVEKGRSNGTSWRSTELVRHLPNENTEMATVCTKEVAKLVQ